MTLFDVEELTAYWSEHPPVHILVGAYLGAGKNQRRQTPAACSAPGRAAPADLHGILAGLGPGFGTGDVHAGLPGVVLDFADLRSRAKREDCSPQGDPGGRQ
jgi:hypothetical protein